MNAFRWLRASLALSATVTLALYGRQGMAQGLSRTVKVTDFRVSKPGIAGGYSTANCTIENTGTSDLSLKGVAVRLQNDDGTREDFPISAFNPKLGVLHPGEKYTFRKFRRFKDAGTYNCVVAAQNVGGQWENLTTADGRPATVSLTVMPADSIPRASFQVTDTRAKHVYAPGERISVQVTPLLVGGSDLSNQVKAFIVAPGDQPFSMTASDSARTALLGDAKGKTAEFRADFWGVPEEKRFLEIDVHFATPVSLASCKLSGFNHNGEYDVKSAEIKAYPPSGLSIALPTVIVREDNSWDVVAALKQNLLVKGLRWHISTPYKLNLTKMSLRGTPTDSAVAAPSVSEGRISYQWTDAFGKALTQAQTLAPFQSNTVSSPTNLAPGYYGLALTTTFPNMDDAHQEYGFVVLPKLEANPIGGVADRRMGLVHLYDSDPNMGAGWSKTAVANYGEGVHTLDATGWKNNIAARRKMGYEELPLVVGPNWATPGDKPVSDAQLSHLKTQMVQYFKADPTVKVWELGLEENLAYRGHRDTWTFFWPNLAAKAKAVREASKEAGVNVQLAYQIAERDTRTIDEFFDTGTAKSFDVLSLHPYAWPDFPAPEEWMPEFIGKVRAAMTRTNTPLRIWFTEIGAPHDGNPGNFFGYPDIGAYDRGLSGGEEAGYLVKCHLEAFRLGVDKLFWYNYRDASNSADWAESHFGLVTYAGYPQPAYAAYSTLSRLIRNKPFEGETTIDGDVRSYHFKGQEQDTYVVWTYPAKGKRVSLKAIGIDAGQVVTVQDVVGKPVRVENDSLAVLASPQYLLVRH